MNAIDSHAIGVALRDFCVAQLEELASGQLLGLELPRTYGGHVVAADVRADLIYTLGHLRGAGVGNIAGRRIDEILVDHLERVDGASTHTFFSYRVAETLAAVGGFDHNPLLLGLNSAQRDEVRRACESNDWIALLDDGKLPRNYAAVLARCEAARERLGLDVDPDVLTSLLQRLQSFLGSNPGRYLDDSHDRSGRYDIYTADVWLFCEPLADRLDGLWEEGIDTALRLVEAVGGRDGTAVPWGRSTGVLSVALTIELAAIAVARGLQPDHTTMWLHRLAGAATAIPSWFSSGVTNAHQYRDQDAYRGPARRLQLTFDVLGKIAWAAKILLAADPVVGFDEIDAFAQRDEMLAFEELRPAGAWTYRGPALEFVVPFVGAARSHYYPAVHAPGSFEVPVDADLPCWVPIVHSGFGRFAGGGVPVSAQHEPFGVRAKWDGFPATAFDYTGVLPAPLCGTRTTHFRVDGRSIVLDEALEFDAVPNSVTVIIPEIGVRPLLVEFATESRSTQAAVDVKGLKEWRSSWSEISVAHQLDVEPSTSLAYSIRVTPKLRVASTAFGHHYHRSLYGPIENVVVATPSPLGLMGDSTASLDGIDVFHMHWPEWVAFDDIDEHKRIIASLQARRIPIVWTAHNLTPHEKNAAAFDPVYSLWAAAADAVIHHSKFGEGRMRARYAFAELCRHEVIPHGHFGGLWDDVANLDRAEAERQLGLASTTLRIGLVGAPRAEKHVLKFLDAVTRCARRDIEVVCWSLRYGESAPPDTRIAIAEQYKMVSEQRYAQRLSVCDVLAMPFDLDGEMLATGTVADALGLGIPVLSSGWEFLNEMLADAAIFVGDDADTIARSIDGITGSDLQSARSAARERKPSYDWQPLAVRTAEVFEAVVLS